jgi:hypothetical protein
MTQTQHSYYNHLRTHSLHERLVQDNQLQQSLNNHHHQQHHHHHQPISSTPLVHPLLVVVLPSLVHPHQHPLPAANLLMVRPQSTPPTKYVYLIFTIVPLLTPIHIKPSHPKTQSHLRPILYRFPEPLIQPLDD